jgi:hypothetical protein
MASLMPSHTTSACCKASSGSSATLEDLCESCLTLIQWIIVVENADIGTQVFNWGSEQKACQLCDILLNTLSSTPEQLGLAPDGLQQFRVTLSVSDSRKEEGRICQVLLEAPSYPDMRFALWADEGDD